MGKVDFFIAGVQKGGTTALDAMLREHPAIQMASKKEVHIFDDETLDWSAPDYKLLHKHFDWTAADVKRGEATPIYTYWPNSMERLAAYNPDAKIAICLRHPAYRAYSHWQMETKRERDDLCFSDAIRSGRQRVGKAHRVFSYVERGFYAQQIARAQTLFEHVHFIRTDRLWSDTGAEVAQLCQFLGVAPINPERKYTAPVDTRGGAPILRDDLSQLVDLYADDIRATQALTGLDLNDWLDASYAEPMET